MKIGIIGTGAVGSAAAYAMLLRGVGSELVLIDKNQAMAQAQATDISHAAPVAHPITVRAGEYTDLADATLVVITAGVAQKPGESRLDLLQRNANVFEDIVNQVLRHAPDATLVIASNPVDIMTHFTTRLTGLSSSRVIGSGTILDTMRFRTLLGTHFNISPKSIHAYVVGEHGDSEVLCWSSATVASLTLADFAAQVNLPITPVIRAMIDDGVRNAAAAIIAGKGATWFGIGGGLARLAQVILDNEDTIMSVSVVDEVFGRNVCVSLPRIIGRQGIVATLHPSIDAEERIALEKSAQLIYSITSELLQKRGLSA